MNSREALNRCEDRTKEHVEGPRPSRNEQLASSRLTLLQAGASGGGASNCMPAYVAKTCHAMLCSSGLVGLARLAGIEVNRLHHEPNLNG